MRKLLQTSSAKSRWDTVEPFIFWLLILLNLFPVLGVQYYLTGDGPSHLYNAQIILDLVSNSNSVYKPFFSLRRELIPNIAGHALLAFLSGISNPWIAEKVLYCLYLVGLPLAFRFAAKSISGSVSPLVFIAFLLIHNFCLQIGFQGFCLSLAFMFWSIGLAYIAYEKKSILSVILFGVVLFITTLFHLFGAAVTLIVAFLMVANTQIKDNRIDLKAILPLLYASLPTVIFVLAFLAKQKSEPWSFSIQESLSQFFPFIKLSLFKNAEVFVSTGFFTLLVFGVIRSLIIREKPESNWFVAASGLILLILFFILPDDLASGGYLHLRLLTCALMLISFWMAIQFQVSTFSLVIGGLFIALSVIRLPFLHRFADELSDDVATILEAQPFLNDGETLVPLNYSAHWLHYGISAYLGVDKKVIILDNYEASTSHFPVQWKESVLTPDGLGNAFHSNRPRLHIKRFENATGVQVDAVTRWKYETNMVDSATLHTNDVLVDLYDLNFSSLDNRIKLYRRK